VDGSPSARVHWLQAGKSAMIGLRQGRAIEHELTSRRTAASGQ